MTTTLEARSELVDYYIQLQEDLEVPYPSNISKLNDAGIDFEINCLFKYIVETTNSRSPYYLDLPLEDIKELVDSPNDDVKVSALIAIMDNRIPQLHLKSRV